MIPDEVNFPALFLPHSDVRHAPILVCGMLQFGCAIYSVFTARHALIYGNTYDSVGQFNASNKCVCQIFVTGEINSVEKVGQ